MFTPKASSTATGGRLSGMTVISTEAVVFGPGLGSDSIVKTKLSSPPVNGESGV